MTNYAQGGHVGGGGGFWLDGCTPRYIAYPAPDLSPAEAEIVARFESAPTPPEVREARVVEEVARAIDEARDAHGPFYFPCKCGWEAGFGAGWEDRGNQHRLLSIAAAAVAAYRAAQDGGAEHGPGKCVPMEDANRALYVAGDAEMQLEALSAQDGGAEEALRRVEALAEEMERDAADQCGPLRDRIRDTALRLRAALAPQAGDGAR